ncbi:hypothetical protein ACJQWK_08309 [Exserohilum turcicum]
MSPRLFMTLVCMSFLWVGSQIPLYLFGSIITLLQKDIGGADRSAWFAIAYLIPLASVCPFVGALSDLFGRQKVAIVGQLTLIIGPIITATAHNMNVAIAGQVFSGVGAGLNELIALAGTGEIVPVKDRGKYVGGVILTILPFCPAVLWAQFIAQDSSWRFNGLLIGLWNFVGLVLCIFCYHDPSRLTETYTARHVLRQVDYVGGFLSVTGITLFMMGLQWGALQYKWGSAHNLGPFIIGCVFIIAFFVWEFYTPTPMVPRKLFSKAKRTMTVILLITFLSGGNFFVLIIMWPTEIYNLYGDDPTGVGLRSLPIGFGIMVGACLCLVLIPITNGRIRELMIFFTGLMTAGSALISIATPHNLAAMYVIVSLAATGIGAVIFPSSIIAQIACPDELIATVTAITLSIRYIGGAIGYSIFTTVFARRAQDYLTNMVGVDVLVGKLVVNPLAPGGIEAITVIVTEIANARFEAARTYVETNPAVLKHDAYPMILAAAQESFALAYRYPYWISIAFGVPCFILSFFLGNIRAHLTSKIAVIV